MTLHGIKESRVNISISRWDGNDLFRLLQVCMVFLSTVVFVKFFLHANYCFKYFVNVNAMINVEGREFSWVKFYLFGNTFGNRNFVLPENLNDKE